MFQSLNKVVNVNRRRSSIDLNLDNNLEIMIEGIDEKIEPCGSAIKTILRRDYVDKAQMWGLFVNNPGRTVKKWYN